MTKVTGIDRVSRITALVSLSLVLSGITFAQTARINGSTEQKPQTLSGSLDVDLTRSISMDRIDSIQALPSAELPGHKSPIRAALFSAVLPGAGQLYTDGYWQSAAFLGAEVGLWVVYAVYNKKGDDKTDFFQNFGDQHWSEVRYAQWIHQYFPNVLPDVNSVLLPNTAGLPPWQQINLPALNSVEDQMGQISNSGFTHRLEARPAQQHYELIGKYTQFLGGWDDATSATPSDVSQHNVSPNFASYSQMRGDANSLYSVATTATYVLVANHIFSALEAAFAAARFNAALKMGAHIEPVMHPDGLVEFIPTARMQLEF